MPGGRAPKLSMVVQREPVRCAFCRNGRAADGSVCQRCAGRGYTGEEADVTVAEVIVRALSTGQYMQTAVDMADVSRSAVTEWLRTGVRLSAQIEGGTLKLRHLSHHQRDMVDFARRAVRALAESEARGVASIAAAGQLPQVTRRETTVTKTDSRGATTTTTTVVIEEAPPDWRAEAWRMERRFRARWSDPFVEDSGLEEGPTSLGSRVSQLRERITTLRDGNIIDLPVRTGGNGSAAESS